jgi:tetratricopeptide (TPR) repeat protein|tara:strand:- start:44 stop:640 length:597 start_codon:yes stop_codon:yes gene_type:complete
MENGFAKLIASLEALTESFNNLNINQITEDMTTIVEGVEDIAFNLENYLVAMEDYNASVAIYSEALIEYNDALLSVGEAYAEFENLDDATEALAQAIEGLRLLAEEGNQWAGLFYQIAQINLTLDQILVTVQTFATKDQVEGILNQLEEMGEGIDQLVAAADYDYDGVINALDKCPDTPLNEINNVNSDGCSPSQLNN